MKHVTTPAQKVFIVPDDPGLRQQLQSLIATRGVHWISLKSAAEYSGLELQQQIGRLERDEQRVLGDTSSLKNRMNC